MLKTPDSRATTNSRERRMENSGKVQEKPEYQSVGRQFRMSVIQGQQFEHELSRDRCLSPRRSANDMIWKVMRITIRVPVLHEVQRAGRQSRAT